MANRRGSWLEGPGSARPVDPDFYPGSRLGVPETGPGSIATTGKRALAFLVDSLLAGLIAGVVKVVTSNPSEGVRGLVGLVVFIVMTAVLLATGGQTIGMRVLSLQLVPIGRLRFPWALAVTVRTLLLALLVPALIFDRDGRGWHDKAAATAVVQV